MCALLLGMEHRYSHTNHHAPVKKKHDDKHLADPVQRPGSHANPMRRAANKSTAQNSSSTPRTAVKTHRTVVTAQEKQNTRWREAMKNANFEALKALVEEDSFIVDLPDENHHGQTPIMRLCHCDVTEKQRRELCNSLLSRGVDLNTQDSMGRTVLAHACIKEREAVVWLLADEPDLNPGIPDNEENTVLIHAARVGNVALISKLIALFKRFRLDVDRANLQGMTPLIQAAKLGYMDCCRVLVCEGKANVSLRDHIEYQTAQQYASESLRARTPDLLFLSPVVRRKEAAKRSRVARGRKILSELALHDHSHEQAKVTKSAEADVGGLSGSFEICHRDVPLRKRPELVDLQSSVVWQMSRKILPRLKEIEEGTTVSDDEEDEGFTGDLSVRRRSLSMSSFYEFKKVQGKSATAGSPCSSGGTSPSNSPPQNNTPELKRAAQKVSANARGVRFPPVNQYSRTGTSSPKPSPKLSRSGRTLGGRAQAEDIPVRSAPKPSPKKLSPSSRQQNDKRLSAIPPYLFN
ncbi:uncharacterized protein [Branchiostoma lanceolatum]|uniref:uncharacterized protein n=1 Tax=Branchiostoma lanceolatum TaxID=7740 RepID=UPI0034559723